MVTLTKKELDALKHYEFELKAAKADYLRSTGRKGQELLHEVYRRVKGEDYRRTDACGQCEYELTRMVADWYFDTIEHNANKAAKAAK